MPRTPHPHHYHDHTTQFLENIAGTLTEFWCSYNKIKSLDNLVSCKKLEVLYISNNELKGYEELDKLVST